MKKKEVQQRVLQGGKPLSLNKFTWDSKTKTFSSAENDLVLDFKDISNCAFKTRYGCAFKTRSECTFDTGYGCAFKTGSGCTFDTGYNCTFKTRYGCTFKTRSECTFDTGYNCTFDTGSGCTFKTRYKCVVVRRDGYEVIELEEGKKYQLAPFEIKGYLKDGIYSETGKQAIIVDGILSEVISKRGNIYKVKNYGDKKETYVVKDGDIYSHGETIKQAKESLIYKISNRDTTEYKSMTLGTVLSKKEAIRMYRVITGACEAGVKYFVESLDKVKKEYTVKEVIELTKGQYGNEQLKKFFGGSQDEEV